MTKQAGNAQRSVKENGGQSGDRPLVPGHDIRTKKRSERSFRDPAIRELFSEAGSAAETSGR
jgi:hypothetical protein